MGKTIRVIAKAKQMLIVRCLVAHAGELFEFEFTESEYNALKGFFDVIKLKDNSGENNSNVAPEKQVLVENKEVADAKPRARRSTTNKSGYSAKV